MNSSFEIERVIHPHQSDTGVVLGPYEALVAQVLYLNEVASREKWRRHGMDRLSLSAKKAFRVPFRDRDRIFGAFLLFGKLDAMAASSLINTFLASRGLSFSAREFFGDFGPLQPEPFSHGLENYHAVDHFGMFNASSSDVQPIVKEIVKSLQYAGMQATQFWDPPDRYEITIPDVTRALPSIFIGGGYMSERMLSRIGFVGSATLNSVERAIHYGIPLLSGTQVGPSWLTPDVASKPLAVLRVVFEGVSWLPCPRTFGEAISLANDDRVVSLRRDILLWTEQLNAGKYENLKELSLEIERQSEAFAGKPWATRVAGVISYAAIPTTAADVLLGQGYIGAAAAVAGTAAQFISDAVERSKRKSWLSLGTDLLGVRR